jgi:hypothetical protein
MIILLHQNDDDVVMSDDDAAGIVNIWDIRAVRNRRPFLASFSLDKGLEQLCWSQTTAGVFVSA